MSVSKRILFAHQDAKPKPDITVACDDKDHIDCGGYIMPVVHGESRPCHCHCHRPGGHVPRKPYLGATDPRNEDH